MSREKMILPPGSEGWGASGSDDPGTVGAGADDGGAWAGGAGVWAWAGLENQL